MGDRGRSFRGRGVRQTTEWIEGPGGGTSQAISAAGEIILGNGISPNLAFTLRRLRGEILYTLTSVAAATDEVRMTSGIAVVSADAFVLGITAMPDPLEDAGYPWVWWDTVNFNPEIAAPEGVDGVGSVRRVVDSKAMRKMKPDETLAWIVEFSGESGTVVAAAMASSRMLVSF